MNEETEQDDGTMSYKLLNMFLMRFRMDAFDITDMYFLKTELEKLLLQYFAFQTMVNIDENKIIVHYINENAETKQFIV